MDTMTVENIKHELLSLNPEFRELANEHGRYESRLHELSALPFPSDEEQWEETMLKKKKLAIKDQMYEIMLRHQSGAQAAH